MTIPYNTFYNIFISQHFTRLYKTLQVFTIVYKTLQNFTKYKNITKLCNPLHKLYHTIVHNFTILRKHFTKLFNTLHNFTNIFKLYNTLQISTILYKPLHMCTKLFIMFNTSQRFTTLVQHVYNTAQHSTTLYNTLTA